jgi:predicted alpha/beta hydrolase family esterase
MKRVFIIHGYTGSPNIVWYPWLRNELERLGVEVKVLKMPNRFFPKKQKWVKTVGDSVGDLNTETYFVGHSLGANTLMHYFAEMSGEVKLGGVVLVSGPYSMPVTSIRNLYYRIALRSFFNRPIEFRALSSMVGKTVVVHGDNDMIVPISQSEYIAAQLNAPLVVVKKGGHMIVKEAPAVLSAVLKLTTVN